MKKITFFVAFSILLQFMALSQQTSTISAVSYLPKQASGYLILNKTAFPTVKDWSIQIQQKTTNAAGVVFYTTVSIINISNSYFSKLPTQYTGGNYYLKVTGKNVSGTTVVTDGPMAICPGCPEDGQSCKIYCIAPTYAWCGNYTANSTGGNIILTITSTDLPTGEPAYQYFTSAQFTQLPGGSVPPSYYNCTGYNLLQGDKIVQMDILSPSYVVAANGDHINGTVYAIKKYLGPWAEQGIIQAQNIASDFQTICDANASTAASIINNNSFSNDITPPLSCGGLSIGGVGDLPTTSAADFLTNCFTSWFQNLDAGMDPYNAFEVLDNCMHPGSGIGFNWPAEIAVVTFKPFNNLNGSAISLKESDFYSPTGNFTPPPITLQKDLYMMGIQFKDNSYVTLFFESKTAKTYNYPQSNMLSASAAPVPITGNGFDLNLTAYSNLRFTYTLKNASGTQLYSKLYTLSKNQTLQDHITIPNGIPSGQLFNKFTFEDGSQLNFQTYK